MQRPFLHDFAGFRTDLAQMAGAAIPHKPIRRHGKISEAGGIDGDPAIDPPLGVLPGFGIEAVELMRPVF